MLPGYAVSAEIHRGGRTAVYRAIRERDGFPVIIKCPVAEYPSPADTARLRREHQLLQGLDLPGVPRVYGLETHRDRVALVLEDVGGETLKELIARGPLDLRSFFDYALQLAATVGEIHRRGIIHKDINPSNVIVDRGGGRARLADFGIASRLSAERQGHLQHPHLLEGTIAYMSPEQTGRMNRDLDYRSDLYSLGVTFYEMLTGRLPFESADPLEVIHGHVAVPPAAPHLRVTAVPLTLSHLVLKLLAKSAEDRYQSADGVVADLTRCRAAWESGGTIPEFPLGQDDVRDRFVLPQRLYGREQEIARLLEAFDRAATGGVELVLVAGYSGIGKTSLIQEIHRSLAQRRGHFIAGKFEQLGRDIPYSALGQAFDGLVRHLLAGTDEEVEAWRGRVLDALGAGGQVLVDVIPTLGRLLGPQPPVPPMGPTEAQNRFNRVFQQLLGVFASPSHPLVLFLDDLQWADPATLTLLAQFLANPDLRGLLVIGAYRDNEVSPAHPLAATLEQVGAGGAALTRITLPPLATEHLAALLGDAMAVSAETAGALAEVVAEKTGGNPFFTIQFLGSLHQDGQIAFDRERRAWRADLAAIRRLRMTENVVDLMTSRIRRLGESTRRALRLAACVGNRFDLATLATVSECGPAGSAADLWPAVEQGLVLSDEHSYGFAPDPADPRPAEQRRFRFLHDRVQQAAYALIPEHDRPRVHLAVGRLLLAQGEDPARPEWLFDVVNQLNHGAALMDDPAERLGLAELNLAAGRRAKASAAFPSAFSHFAAGAALLPGDAWERHHELAFALHHERAQAEYLTGRLEEAERSYALLLERAATPLERVEAYVLTMNQHETAARYREAVRAGLAGLQLLGIDLPEDRAGQAAAAADDLAAIEAFLAGRPAAVLLELPELREPAIRKAIKLLMTLWAPAFISGESTLSDLAGSRMVRLSLEHGHCEESAYGYVAFASMVGWQLGRYAQAHEFGRLGIALNERLSDLRLRCKVHHRFAALVNIWREPFATSIPHAREAVRTGLECGDFMIAAYGQFQQSWWGMQIEPDLGAFLEKYQPSVEFLQRMRAMAYSEVQKMILHWALAFQGRTESPTSLTGPDFSETTYLETFGRSGLFASWYVTMKLELLATFGAVEEARARAREWEPVAEVFASSVWPALFAFRHALAICAWLPTAPEVEGEESLAKAEELAGRLRLWAENAAANFAHLHRLVEAEIARVRGRSAEAFEHYEAALDHAQRQTSPRHRALVNELYGEFWLGRQQPEVAAAFLREAIYGYRQWGAHAKVVQLERRHAALLGRPVPATDPVLASVGSTQTQASVL
ncbi:MAG TPA: serine/threonine-protein kinase PknK, partial [Gemmatimonadales bacterium]|nr:serine/threonine-protein kinase PknK [Gemmatimonadales bacterium]